MARNASAAGPSPRATGVPASPPRRHRGLERHRSEQRHAGFASAGLAPALAEQGVALAVLARERAHVLDDARDAEVVLASHRRGPHRDLLRRERGRGHDDHLGPRHELGDAHLHVAGAGRHVDEEVVEVVAPLDVLEEVLHAAVRASGPATSAPIPRPRRGTPSTRLERGRRRSRRSFGTMSLRSSRSCPPDDRRRRASVEPRSPRCRRRGRRPSVRERRAQRRG